MSGSAEISEVLEGFVVDIACLRGYPRAERLARAREHSRECSLMGHCIESGFGLVGDDGDVVLLDPAATRGVIEEVAASERERGIRLRVERLPRDGEMRTVDVRGDRG